MKIKSLFVAVLLMGGVLVAPAHANEKPTVESFTFSPQEIDLSGANTTVDFELVVSHPLGINNTSTLISGVVSGSNYNCLQRRFGRHASTCRP